MTPADVLLPPIDIGPEELARRLMPRPPHTVIAHRADSPLTIGDTKIACYVLDDEQRVLSARGLGTAIGVRRGGSGAGGETPEFMHQKWLAPFIHEELVLAARSPVLFANPEGGGMVRGYPAKVLSDLCVAIMDAARGGATTPRQQGIVDRAYALNRGFSGVGLVALIDEATGYQRIREERALATILERYLSEELQPWVKTFPYEFYELLYGLNGWELPPPPNGKMPGVVGTWTIELVYARLAPGVLSEVMKRAPQLPTGSRWHQWFTPEHGHPRVQEQIRMAIAFMRPEKKWGEFLRRYNVACPVYREDTGQLQLDLEQKRQPPLFPPGTHS